MARKKERMLLLFTLRSGDSLPERNTHQVFSILVFQQGIGR